MTPEQKQQWDKSGLKEECQRALKLGRTHQETDIQLFLDMLLEIERLESLVKSQEAPITSLKDLHNSACLYVTHNGACDCVDGVVVNRAAVLMRSRCVEKLRSLARDRVNQSNPNHKDHEYDQAVAHVLLQAANELESVSIEGAGGARARLVQRWPSVAMLQLHSYSGGKTVSSDTQVKQEDRTRALSISLGVACVCGIAHKGSICDKHQRIIDLLATVRREERGAAFTAMALELRNYGPNIRRIDLLTRFQELFRELESTASKEEGMNG